MRRGHKSCRPQQGLPPFAQRSVVLVLREPRHLRHDNRAQGQQLRAPQPLHRHGRAPFNDVLEPGIERVNRLRPQLRQDASPLYPVGLVGVRPAPSGDQCPIGRLTPPAHLRGILGGIAQDITDLGWQGGQHRGRHLVVCGIGRGQFRGPRAPHRPNRHGQGQFPAVPPAMPARLRPPRCRIHRGRRELAALPLLLVPAPAACTQGGTLHRRRPAVLGPRPAHGYQRPADTAHQAGPVRGQGGEPSLPGAASRKPAARVQEPLPRLRHRVVLVEKRAQGIGGLEAASTQEH
jgi:hypothetical protein